MTRTANIALLGAPALAGVVDKDDPPLGLTRPLAHTYRALGLSSGGPFFVRTPTHERSKA